MHNLWLIIRREYLQVVRTRSFLLTTILMPLVLFGSVALPSRLVMSKNKSVSHIAVVASDAGLADAVRQRLGSGTLSGRTYQVDVVLDTSEAERDALRRRVAAGALDGFLWLTDDAMAERKVTFATRATSDFMEDAGLESAIFMAVLQRQLIGHGATPQEAESALKRIKLDTVRVAQGRESTAAGRTQFFASFIMALLLYTSLVLYGVSVMRSVLEEKSSRVLEVMLSSLTATELMAGKILGVGAAGLTQVFIWIVSSLTLGAPALFAQAGAVSPLRFPPLTLGAFAVFFLLGYLLYSTLYAALGAVVNSEQEAQQWQFMVSLPVLIPVVLMTYVLRQPNAPASIWLSLIPFFAPISMFMRMVGQAPPLWQIALCLALMVATIYGLLMVCSRIYRVGILMYGKRPTLPEIMKWVRYA